MLFFLKLTREIFISSFALSCLLSFSTISCRKNTVPVNPSPTKRPLDQARSSGKNTDYAPQRSESSASSSQNEGAKGIERRRPSSPSYNPSISQDPSNNEESILWPSPAADTTLNSPPQNLPSAPLISPQAIVDDPINEEATPVINPPSSEAHAGQALDFDPTCNPNEAPFEGAQGLISDVANITDPQNYCKSIVDDKNVSGRKTFNDGNAKEVYIVSASWCGYCTQLKTDLCKKLINYKRQGITIHVLETTGGKAQADAWMSERGVSGSWELKGYPTVILSKNKRIQSFSHSLPRGNW